MNAMTADDRSRHRVCVVIPAFREEARINPVVRAVRERGCDVVVVDDGSDDRTAEVARQAGAAVVVHPQNQGKGVALNSGFQYAVERHYDGVITMDADGQHDPDEIPKFLEAYVRTGIPVLIGNRMANAEAMPRIRRWTNRFMSWMLSRAMGQYIPDTQCGYRFYRCDVLPFITAHSERFAAESEILLHVAGRGIRIDSVRISTIYGDEKSRINPLVDTVRFFSMLWRFRKSTTPQRSAGAGR
jgi:glycosyltransferase involved in cell wall biosynthesis